MATTCCLAVLPAGVVPITNLEWIQKIHRDNAERGYSAAIVDDPASHAGLHQSHLPAVQSDRHQLPMVPLHTSTFIC